MPPPIAWVMLGLAIGAITMAVLWFRSRRSVVLALLALVVLTMVALAVLFAGPVVRAGT